MSPVPVTSRVAHTVCLVETHLACGSEVRWVRVQTNVGTRAWGRPLSVLSPWVRELRVTNFHRESESAGRQVQKPV